MKTKAAYFTLFLLTIVQFLNAQCSRTGQFMQSDPAYFIAGDASLIFEANGDKNVTFASNFSTVQGADLRVYLSKTDDIANAQSDAIQISGQLINDDGGTDGPGVSPITGMMTFPIPVNVELQEFDFIVIQCIAINERWGYVALGTEKGAGCTPLSVAEVSLAQTINLYPNPANKDFEVVNDQQLPLSVVIYDANGKAVTSAFSSTSAQQMYSLTSLSKGVYFVEITSGNQRTVKKLIKQ